MKVSTVLILLACIFYSAFAPASAQRVLRIESTDAQKPPKVLVGNTTGDPKFDPVSSKWQVPIDANASSFVTSYLISAEDGSVVAVRLGIPARILSENQFVYLSSPMVKEVDEAAVRSLWQSNEIVRSPRDIRLQFSYLQDLLFINGWIMKRDVDSPRLNSMTLRASFMLFQVVRNLASNTWYVIDPQTQRIIDHARKTLNAGEASGKSCAWLGLNACKNDGVRKLIATVSEIDATRLGRMYAVLVPDSMRLSAKSCGMGLLANLRSFYEYLKQSGDGRSMMAISEARVLNDIAACESAIALCEEPTPVAAISRLRGALAFLQKEGNPATNVRQSELRNSLSDLEAGHPAICRAR